MKKYGIDPFDMDENYFNKELMNVQDDDFYIDEAIELQMKKQKLRYRLNVKYKFFIAS